MRRLGIVLSATLLASLGATAAHAPRAAAAPAMTHCASKAQYGQVSHGMSISRVAQILGHSGHVYQKENNGGYGFQWRSYQACSSSHTIAVRFSKLPKQKLHETAKDYEHK